MRIIKKMLVAIFLVQTHAENNCIPRDYGNGGTVCVCNSTYCDSVGGIEKITPPNYLKYTSNKAGLRLAKSVGVFDFLSNTIPDGIINVDQNVTYQTIIGFGGAFTDATGINVASLSQGAQDLLLHSYFGKDGSEYNLCRVPIGGTDFSTRGYTYNDGPIDTSLNNFKLAPDDYQYKIPLIKRARALNDELQLFASAWTAPKWMKTNGEYAGIGFLKVEMRQVWADYFVKFLDKYAEQGIRFWGITTGNEPTTALANSSINSVAWWSTDMNNWIINNLGPTLRNSNHSDIKLMALDDQRFLLPWFIKTVLRNEARKFVDGIAVHWYWDVFPFTASLLTTTHYLFPEKFLLATEACNGDKKYLPHVLLGSWERGESYSIDIIEDIRNWVTGWLDWNMALDLTGGPTYIQNNVDSPIIVNASVDEFYKQPMYYHLAHFSKFLPRNSIRIYSTQCDYYIPVVAFKRPDNAVVLVILNRRNIDVNVRITDNLRGDAMVQLTAKSITTIIYW